MAHLALSKLQQMAIVLLVVSIIVFFGMRTLPGDPILLLISNSQANEFTSTQIEALRHEYGLDRPIVLQYLSWLSGVLQGDFGNSIYTHTPVIDEIGYRLTITFEIGLIAIAIGSVLGIALGIVSSVRRGSFVDQLVITLSNLGITVPIFWLGLILMLIFGLKLKWLPVMGYTPLLQDPIMHLKQIIMPVFCLLLFPMAAVTRQTRSSMLEVLHQDYIRTAWAKGLEQRTIIWRHALKNALTPVITTIGLSVPMTVGGQVMVETVFNIPGMGRLLVSSVQSQDYAYVQAIVVIVAFTVVTANTLADLAYGWADPRINHR